VTSENTVYRKDVFLIVTWINKNTKYMVIVGGGVASGHDDYGKT